MWILRGQTLRKSATGRVQRLVPSTEAVIGTTFLSAQPSWRLRQLQGGQFLLRRTTTRTFSTVLDDWRSKVAKGALINDEGQEKAAKRLHRLQRTLEKLQWDNGAVIRYNQEMKKIMENQRLKQQQEDEKGDKLASSSQYVYAPPSSSTEK